VKIVERIVFWPCLPCDAKREVVLASSLAKEPGEIDAASDFPTMAEMERTMILAAYQRSNRKPLEAARLPGIGKTTVYRKLREMKQVA
jgi:transcriptional regulator of acetoin/glycerol metabolism